MSDAAKIDVADARVLRLDAPIPNGAAEGSGVQAVVEGVRSRSRTRARRACAARTRHANALL